jgi:hypothetical protein
MVKLTIETIGSIGENKNNNVKVQNSHVRSLPPRHTSKFLASKEEMSFSWLIRNDLLGPLRRSEKTHDACSFHQYQRLKI